MTSKQNYLTDEQVGRLNDKHGYFEYRDSQGDVSRAFAQEAIELHERIRAGGPALLNALIALWRASEGGSDAEIQARLKARLLIIDITGSDVS